MTENQSGRFLTSGLFPWLVFALLIGLVAAIILLASPTQLVVAVGQNDLDEPKVIQALSEALNQERASVRLTTLLTAGPAQSAQMLASGKADLAVVRSDTPVGQGVSSLIGLRRFNPVVLARKGSKIDKIKDLRGKRIGIGAFPAQNLLLANRLLAHWGLQEGDYSLIPLQPGDISDNLRDRRIDAFLSMTAAGSRPAGRLVEIIRSHWGRDFVLLPFDDVNALIAKIPGLEAGQIPKGYFGGDPVRPEEDLDTIAISNRIVAGPRLGNETAASLTRILLALRDKRQGQNPELLSIDEPVRSNPTLPVHPGSAQVLDGTYEGFIDRYTNHFYIGLAFLGGVGTIVNTYSRRRRERLRLQAVSDLQAVLAIGDRIEHLDEPAAIATELLRADDILKQALLSGASGELQPGQVAALQGAVARCHRAAELEATFRAHVVAARQAAMATSVAPTP